MSVTFSLKHNTDPGSWLAYSHANIPPKDRFVFSGAGILSYRNTKFANWYFLSDEALQILSGTKYTMTSSQFVHFLWHLEIEEVSRATLFKLRFM